MSWSICMTASGQAVQRREAQASAAVPEAGQGDQRQGAPVLRDRPGAAGSEGKRQRPLCRHRGGDSRDEFTESVSEAELLARPEGFDHLHLVGENFATLRRYTPALLEVLELRAAPAAQGVLAAVQTLREMNADNLRKVPADAPTAFIKPRWKPLVITPEGLDRKFYEICALSELKNALRSGDIWVKGSRQFRDFDDYLLPAEKFAALKREQALPPAINPNSDQYRKSVCSCWTSSWPPSPAWPRTTSCPMPSSPSQG
ncbi:hypothetical protein [Klebsiella pneumoniae]|uniref:hypothetical protein n=1 Tax=Klebsiella pneumoniae TaxID=573 RepID=UPI00388D4814